MSITAADFDFVRTLVHRRSAIVLEPGKEYLVDTRLGPLAKAEGLASVADLVRVLRGRPSPGLLTKVTEAMTTNETSFFRDLTPFEALRTTVLPALMEARKAERRLTIWCAACSSGQEPYSIAMVLKDHFAGLPGWTVRIVATDLDTEVLERARLGRYTQAEVNRGLPGPLLVKHFVRSGLEWQVKDEVRRMVEFRSLNLAEAWPAMPAADVVFLRNVLIYFDADTKRAILARTKRLLRPDGYLFLGGAETTLNLDDAFRSEPIQGGARCYRLGEAARPGIAAVRAARPAPPLAPTARPGSADSRGGVLRGA